MLLPETAAVGPQMPWGCTAATASSVIGLHIHSGVSKVVVEEQDIGTKDLGKDSSYNSNFVELSDDGAGRQPGEGDGNVLQEVEGVTKHGGFNIRDGLDLG